MVASKLSLICLIVVYCVIKVQSGATGLNHCNPEIPCDDSSCIDRQEWCDGLKDCTDESDEKYCKVNGYFYSANNNCDDELHFTCKNSKCIPKVLTCDGFNDCKDNSDEKHCENSETGGKIDPDWSLNKPIDSSENDSSTESSHLLPSEVPQRPSTPGLNHNIRTFEPTVDYYDNRWAEGGSTKRQHYNREIVTASAYPFHPPVPTPDPRYSPVGARYPDERYTPVGARHPNERSFDNLDRQRAHTRRASSYPPSKEPCDKTISGSDNEPTIHYSVPWSGFTFESSHSDSINNQFYSDAKRAVEWLLTQRDEKLIWGENTPRALVALALSSDATYNVAADDILQRRLRIDLGVRLIKWRERPLSASGLALYINALIATCQNPRNVFERDLVEMLYQKVQRERTSPSRMDASPFPYITLCLTDRSLTEDDRRFLQDVARRNVTDEISKDKFILAASALACLKKTQPPSRELHRSVDDAFYKLQQQQLNDGSFGSVYSTALAAQAFISIDSRLWDPQSTLNYLSGKQHADGSFGDFLATYYALPVLRARSLLHLRNIQCQTDPSPPPRPPTAEETEPPPPPPPLMKTVHYRLATQKPYETIVNLDFVVPVGTNFFDIMKIAQDQDKRYRFLYVEHDRKIDVYQINRIPNDPEFGMFWILYTSDSTGGNQLRYTQDIRNLIPEDGDKLLFYYVQFKPGQQ